MTRAVFERVSYPDVNGKRRTILLRDVADNGRALSGLEIDREGNLVEPSAAALKAEGATTGVKQHLILHGPGEMKRTRMVECWLTGRLVVDGRADQQVNPSRYR